jgi:putative transcriptional regulator
MSFHSGQLLVSVPAMEDPNFEGTVVVLVEHDEHGTTGLTLNRPLDIPLQEVLGELPWLEEGSVPLQWGGPVMSERMHLLSSSPAAPNDALEVVPGLHFGGGLDDLRRLHEQEENVRLFLGYSGWSPGQLQAEVDANAWHLLPVDMEEVFTTSWRLQWERLMGKIDPRYRWMRDLPEDPSVN